MSVYIWFFIFFSFNTVCLYHNTFDVAFINLQICSITNANAYIYLDKQLVYTVKLMNDEGVLKQVCCW